MGSSTLSLPAVIESLPPNAFGRVMFTALLNDPAQASAIFVQLLLLRDITARLPYLKWLHDCSQHDAVFDSAYQQIVRLQTEYDRLSIISPEKKSDRAQLQAIKIELKKWYDNLFQQLQPLLRNDLTAEAWIEIIQAFSTSRLDDPMYSSSILATPVIAVASNQPNTIALRDAKEALDPAASLATAIRIEPKSGGKNNPGMFGAVYAWPYMTPDGRVQFAKEFDKQPTDFDKKTHKTYHNRQEAIAEIMGGRLINRRVGALSGPITTKLSPTFQGKTDPDGVYVGSIYHHHFIDLHTAAYIEGLQRHTVPKRKAKILGAITRNQQFKKGVEAIFSRDPLQREHLEITFGKTVGANLWVGNNQIHAENIGLAEVDGKRSVVSLDYGGAFRRKMTFREMEVIGRFEREVKPLSTTGKKYFQAYLTDYPESIYQSRNFVKGILTIADAPLTEIDTDITESIRYSILAVGEAAFYDDFAKNLDTRPQSYINQKNRAENIQAVTETTHQFLVDTLIARQLSLKEFALDLLFSAFNKQTALLQHEVIWNNPAYALTHSLMTAFTSPPATLAHSVSTQLSAVLIRDFNLLQHHSVHTPQAVRDLVTCQRERIQLTLAFLQQNAWPSDDNSPQHQMIAELTLLQAYFENAVDHQQYDLSQSSERMILQLACDRSYMTLRNTITQLPTPALQQHYLALQQLMTPNLIITKQDRKNYAATLQQLGRDNGAKMQSSAKQLSETRLSDSTQQGLSAHGLFGKRQSESETHAPDSQAVIRRSISKK